tara:strand:+ start:499 stop:1029 length:531 start_codon:yes stop_codon:yes gene_type:complete
MGNKIKKRICVFCEDEFEGTSQYCSKECQNNQNYANNKNPVGHVARKEGVLGQYDYQEEQHLSPEVQWVLDNDEGDTPRITEDQRYIRRCLHELSSATYSDGTKLIETTGYKERKRDSLRVGFFHIAGENIKREKSFNNKTGPINDGVKYKQYTTFDEKIEKLKNSQKNYTVFDDD